MASIADLFFTGRIDDGQLVVDAKKSGEKAGGALGKSLGAKMEQSARGGISALGAAGGAIFAGAVEAGATFEDQLRTINTVAGLTDQELAGVGDALQGLSRETGKSTDDLTAGFYDLVSAGVPAKDAINVLRDSAKFATGALGTTGEAVDLVTSAMNAYGLKAGDSTRITDIFAKAVADGKVTAAELGSSLANIAPIAASAGVSLEEVSAGYAMLTAKGVPAAQAATQMRAAISALLTPNATLNKLQEKTGINFAKLADEKGLAVTLEEIRKATGGNNEEFAKALGSTEAYSFALATTGENAEAFATQIVETTETAGLAQAQYDEKSKSSVEQGKRLSAVLNTLVQDFGGMFGALGPAVTTLNGLAPALRGLISPAKLVGGLIGGLAGKIGGPLLGAMTKAFGAAEIGTRLETLGLKAQTAWIKGMTKLDPLTSGISDALGRIPGAGKIGAASDRLGQFMGSKIGKALSVGLAAFAVVELVKTFGEVQSAIKDQTQTLADQTAEFTRTATTEALVNARKGIAADLAAMGNDPIAEALGLSAKKGIQDTLGSLDAEIARRASQSSPIIAAAGADLGDKYGKAIATATAATSTNLTASLAGLVAGATAAAGGPSTADAKRLGALAGAGVAAGINEKRSEVDNAWTALLLGLKNAMTPTQERAKLLGYLASTELAKGLKSGDPAVRAQARATKQQIIDRLTELKAGAKNIGKDGMEDLRRGMKSKDPDIRRISTQIYNSALSGPKKVPPQMRIYGQKAGAAYAAGLRSTYGLVNDAAYYVARGAVGPFKASSPPGPDSPLHRIDVWGAKTITAWADGMKTQAAKARGAAMSVVAGTAMAFSGSMPLGSVVPSVGVSAGAYAPTGVQAVDQAIGGDTFQLSVMSAQPVDRPIDIVRELRIAAGQGHFRKNRR